MSTKPPNNLPNNASDYSLEKVNRKIESLCEQGCTQVNQLISDAKDGNTLSALAEFKPSEVHEIVEELNKIMSIYNETASEK